MAGNDDVLAGVGELIFSLMISYLGALEFLFVARQLYHWTCQHPSTAADAAADAEELPRLRQRLAGELNDATAREETAGTNVMQDGVLYCNGIRVDAADLNHMPADKREALEAELQRQKRIEEDTRKQLAAAEAKLAEDRRIAAEKQKAKAEEEAAENAKQLIEAEKRKEAEEREQEENENKLREPEKQREREEHERKVWEAEQQEREQNERKLMEIERQREIEQQEIEQREREEHERKVRQAEQKERQENERKLQEAEKQRVAKQREREEQETEQRERELEENESKLAAAEEARQAAQRQAELAEAEERKLFDVKSQGAAEEQERRDAEIVERLLAAERERKLSATESELEEEAAIAEQTRRLLTSKTQMENKQKLIDENARRFLEAEEEMVMLQQRMLEATQDDPYAGQIPVIEEPCIKKYVAPKFEEPTIEEPVIVQKVKTQFGQSSSNEEPYKVKSKTLMFPGVSDEGSSVEPNSSQQSSFSTQPSDEFANDAVRIDLETERQEPDGEDNVPDVQYTEDYLRSLDGIKSRPLIREDGSGRRRAFKKRRSSGSSNSSRDSRASRDEELKMFTSLEEEELRQGAKEDYNPVKYTSEPTLRVKSHHRRHKRSPAKDVKSPGSEGSPSLEMLGEENTNPWGELVPEHYKDTEFWKREKALSIDEEELELEKHASGEEVIETEAATAKASSFEEATEAQNQEAATALTQQRSKDEPEKINTETSKMLADSSSSDAKSNLQTSDATEQHSRHSSPGLRRSPRIDEMDHYEERWVESEADTASKASASQPPSITVHKPDTAPWRDQYGLMMEGLSDFYDFTASVNPSRSRSASRNASPVPKNVANLMDVDKQHSLEVYDDTNDLPAGQLNCELVMQLLETTMNASTTDELQLQNVADDVSQSNNPIMPMVYESQDDATPNAFIRALREERARSRSRSRSPLPTTRNLERSISVRKERLIKQNDELFERLSSGRNSPMDVEPTTTDSSDSVLPQPVMEINDMAEAAAADCVEHMEDDSPHKIRLFVETLRAERSSRSRSRSPLPNADNIERSLETRRMRRIQHNDEVYEKLHEHEKLSSQSPELAMPAPPTISIECVEAEAEVEASQREDEPVDTPESMARLFEQLRLNRIRSHSCSRSKSPLPSAANLEHSLEQRRQKLIAQNDEFFEQLQQRASTPEPAQLTVENVYEYVETEDYMEVRDMRSLSPSRSRSMSPKDVTEQLEDFQLMLNLEGSTHRTLSKNSEEIESVLAAKQREVDREALLKLTNAQEEIELRVLSPTATERQRVSAAMESERMPDYERTTSEVARDIKDEILASNFKRSTYVGESLELGSEFEQLRRETARFQRSHSPSPSIDALDLAESQAHAAAQRELQAAILDSLTTASGGQYSDANRLGAKPKTNEYERTGPEQMLASGFQHSTYVGSESLDLSAAQLDDMRQRAADFQRSHSRSRSPLADEQINTLKNIDAEAAKRELQDELLDQLAASTVNFQNFSRYLNTDFLDSERRASDSALMQSDPYADLEPEEYHHFRRYSLAQEQPVEEYPSDDYVYVSQIEVRTATGKRTWLKEDFYTQDLASLDLCFADSDSLETIYKENAKQHESADKLAAFEEGAWTAAEFDATNAIYNYDIFGDYSERDNYEDGSTNDSEDERQTVVEMEDEFDEGISDNNERTQPTDESHHDTSECEEAERNADRYANRGANDWNEADDVDDFLDYSLDEGAVGGVTPYSDPDSFIEQIYNEAVKNRKQSGILREYETMVMEQLPTDNTEQSESDKEKSSSDSEHLSKKRRGANRLVDVTLGLESERRESEMRYLGDADVVARQSTRLRTRYGYNPQLQVGVVDDDIEVDLNYKPKREYNWRKNFKLDDNEPAGEPAASTEPHDMEATEAPQTALEFDSELLQYNEEEDGHAVPLDLRRFSLGGESITLFSRSPVREILPDLQEETITEAENAVYMEPAAEAVPSEEAAIDKPKKKKSKKKIRKGSKTDKQLQDDNDSDTQTSKRRGSEETTNDASAEPAKRKTRSRRSSKSSLTNEDTNDSNGLFSPRSSLSFAGEALEGIAEQDAMAEADSLPSKKKVKKRSKKSRDENSTVEGAQAASNIDEALTAALAEIAPVAISVSTQMSAESTPEHVLSVLSTGQSVCVTPASSVESATTVEPNSLSSSHSVITSPSSNAVATRSIVDSFDILKDANFYPLF